jgi:hypothetical protein
MALAKATTIILQWVRQSAPINEWDMLGSSIRADARPKDGRRNGVPTVPTDFLDVVPGLDGVARRAVPHQPIEMHADMSGLRSRIGERNGPVEGRAGLLGAP